MTTAAPEGERLVEMTAEGVRRIDGKSAVVLQEVGGARELTIFIGDPEAAAIAFGLQGVATRRPMTHDALKQLVDALGARPARILVGWVRASCTYTADVTLVLPDGTERRLDWRVSDAVALGVRTEPRPEILVPETILVAPPPTPPPA